MAQFEINPDKSFQEFLEKMTADGLDEIAPKMLEEAAPILASAVKGNLPSELTGYSTKVKTTKPKKSKNGAWVVNINVTGTTPRSKDKLRNNELMAYWEYGSSKNPKTGFMRQAKASSADEIQNKLLKVFEQEVSG